MHYWLLFWAVVMLAACERQDSLQIYAQEVPTAIQSGPALQYYLADTRGLSPEIRLAKHYKTLRTVWRYRPDPPGFDHFRPVETMIKKQNFAGDCEDFAIIMLAICQNLHLHCQLALGQNGQRGHIWTEVRLARSKVTASTRRKIINAFGCSTDEVKRNNGEWLQLSPERSLQNYTVTHIISPNGQLTSVVTVHRTCQHPQKIRKFIHA